MRATFSLEDLWNVPVSLISFVPSLSIVFEESYIQVLLLSKNMFGTGIENIDTKGN